MIRKGQAGVELPRVPALSRLYRQGVRLSQGMILMITGRSGSGKSMLAMWLAQQMNLRAMYFSADMSQSDATDRLAACVTGDSTATIQRARESGTDEKYSKALESSNINFSFRNPMTWDSVENYIQAYVEVYDAYPELFIYDNLKDFDGAEAEYGPQMEVMQRLTELARFTGSTVIVLHHATDKGWDAKANPWAPPSRDQIKNGLSEQPELTLSVGFDPTSNRFGIAVIKNRSGRSDPSAQHPVGLYADLERVQFYDMDFSGAHKGDNSHG